MSRSLIKKLMKQFIYISHAISLLIFMIVFAINYKLSLQKSLIYLLFTTIIFIFLISGFIIGLTLFRYYLSPNKRIGVLFKAARKQKGMIIDSRVGFTGVGIMVGLILAGELSKFLEIPIGSNLNILLLISGCVLGGIYGYYSLSSLKKSFKEWESLFSEGY